MKRFIALLLALCCVVPFAACGGDPEGPGGGLYGTYNRPGENKTVLKFMNFNGGIGTQWLIEAAERFAEANQNTSFDPNGVHQGIYIDISGSMSISVNPTDEYALYTAEQFEDIVPAIMARSNKVYDITEWVMDDTREGGSIDSIIYDQVKGSLGSTDKLGNYHYYGLPHYECYSGLQYNRDIFDEIGCLFVDESEPNAIPYDSKFLPTETVYFADPDYIDDVTLTVGPDGKEGTDDDGLPVSMQELLVLFDYINDQSSYKPIVISGACYSYFNYFLAGLMGSLAGYDQMVNYYNCEGEVEFCKVEGGGNVLTTNEDLFPGVDYIKKPQTEKREISQSEGWRVTYMKAKYYAIAALEIFKHEGWFARESTISTISHYDAQKALMLGKKGNYENVATLIEASYWYHESEEGGCFDDYELLTGKDYKNLDVRMFSLPGNYDYTDDPRYQDTFLVEQNHCYMFANANIEGKPEIINATKAFMQFLYTDEELQNFTVCCGQARALKYNLDATQLESCRTYIKHMWNARNWEDGSNVIYCSGTTDAFQQVRGSLKPYCCCNVFGGATSILSKNTGTAEIFQAAAITETNWSKVYSPII